MKVEVGQKAPDFNLPIHLGESMYTERTAGEKCGPGVLSAGLDTDMNEPDPVLRGRDGLVHGIKCSGSGHQR